MKRIKLFGSTLHNISKKRQAEIASGALKQKKRAPLAKVSKKTASAWNKARNECFKKYGHKCFLCGATDCEIHVHHFEETRTQNPARKYDITNLVPLCANCHNHHGADKRFYELKCLIYNKLQKQNYDSKITEGV